MWILFVGLLVLDGSAALEGTCTAAQGTCQDGAASSNSSSTTVSSNNADDNCQDKTTECEYWKEVGECDDNPAFMEKRCPRSCNLCSDQLQEDLKHGSDMGERQLLSGPSFKMVTEQETLDRIVAMREYRNNLNINDEIKKTFCINKDASCTVWAIAGECDKNPPYSE